VQDAAAQVKAIAAEHHPRQQQQPASPVAAQSTSSDFYDLGPPKRGGIVSKSSVYLGFEEVEVDESSAV
jgi:hypothetical protein